MDELRPVDHPHAMPRDPLNGLAIVVSDDRRCAHDGMAETIGVDP